VKYAPGGAYEVPVDAEDPVYDETYPSRRLLDIITDKWRPIVLYLLGQAPSGTAGCGDSSPTSPRRC